MEETNFVQKKISKTMRIVPWMFFGVSCISLLTLLLSVIDNIFTICQWSNGMFGPGLTCPAYFGVFVPLVYGYWIAFIVGMILHLLIVPVVLILYFYSFKLVSRDIALLKEKNETEGLAKLVFLKRVLVISPFILVLSWFLILYTGGYSSYKEASLKAAERSRILVAEREVKFKKISEIASKNPDYCPDAPEGISLTRTTGRASDLVLEFPKGYWSGKGVAYLSVENYWDGISSDPGEGYVRMDTYGSLSDFSEGKIYFSNPNDKREYFPLPQGQRYDLRVYTFRESYQDKRIYYQIMASATSSSHLKEESCLTVTLTN